MNETESVEWQLAVAWYDECLRLMREMSVVKAERNKLRDALLVAQVWMPLPQHALDPDAIKDLKIVYEALGLEYPGVEPKSC